MLPVNLPREREALLERRGGGVSTQFAYKPSSPAPATILTHSSPPAAHKLLTHRERHFTSLKFVELIIIPTHEPAGNNFKHSSAWIYSSRLIFFLQRASLEEHLKPDLFVPFSALCLTPEAFSPVCVVPSAPPGCLESGHSAMVTHSKFDNAMSSSLVDSNMRLPHRYKTFASKTQYQMVLATLHKLQECGFYWGPITGKEANVMLAAEATGTFLVRDSSDNKHLYALSVKTASGTKNLRIQCDTASFYLQTDPKNVQSVPHFDCVLKLVHYYMSQSKGNTHSGSIYYIYSGGEKIPLELSKPLACSLSTLQHLCRKTVNGHLDISSKRDQLPHPLKEFLEEYDAPI